MAKSLIKYAIFGILVVFLGGYVLKSCKLSDKNAELRGVIKDQETQLKQQEDRTKQAKEAYEQALREQGLEIVHWQEVADKNSAGMIAGNSKIKDLKEQLAKLNPAEKDAIILKQKELISTLENNLTLAYSTIEAKDGIIQAWGVKFLKWDAYRVELETENLQLRGLVGTQRELIKGLEKDLRLSRLGSKVKNILVLAAAGYLVYGLASK